MWEAQGVTTTYNTALAHRRMRSSVTVDAFDRVGDSRDNLL